MPPQIVVLTADEAAAYLPQLCDLLIDAVESGASVGFLPPLDRDAATNYWRSVIAALREGRRVLLVAPEAGEIQGAVQLDLEMRPNGNHRAEAIKLFVHRRARRRGLAKALLTELEPVARHRGRTLLVMDTRKGGEAEKLCQSLGYVPFGEVPNYARSANGQLHTTVFFYRPLDL